MRIRRSKRVTKRHATILGHANSSAARINRKSAGICHAFCLAIEEGRLLVPEPPPRTAVFAITAESRLLENAVFAITAIAVPSSGNRHAFYLRIYDYRSFSRPRKVRYSRSPQNPGCWKVRYSRSPQLQCGRGGIPFCQQSARAASSAMTVQLGCSCRIDAGT